MAKIFSTIKAHDKETIALFKKINNPNVIATIKNELSNDPRCDSYVTEMIHHWQKYKDDKLELDFEKSKSYIQTYLRLLDKKYKFTRKLSGSIIIERLRKLFINDEIDVQTLYQLVEMLATKNRSHSGVLEIAIMTGPGEFSCKYDCYYCPNQKGIARSYIKEEPAVRRAAQNDFDCVKQINARISSYHSIGQPGDKGEFIILGGTFSNYSDDYRRIFMRDLYYACNTYYDEIKRDRLSLNEEKHINCYEALFKVIGLTVETRPDCINDEELDRYISYGVTRVQLGIQHTDDKLLKKINRKCYTKDTINALKLLKLRGFKVLCHYMPNLPGATPEGDMKLFDDVIYNPDLICDEWKIYPTSITTTSTKDIEDVYTVIEKWYQNGKYTPYSAIELEEVIRYAKNRVPNYIRISRIFRDIPIDNIIGGADVPHMRQKVQKEMALDDEYCKCIRCREIRNREIDVDKIMYELEFYQAQQGLEIFISANYLPNTDTLDLDEQKRMEHLESYIVGFCRLRIQNNNISGNEVDKINYVGDNNNTHYEAIIRELHVYGKMVPNYLSKFMTSNTQHKGIGSNLVLIAERLAKQYNKNKLAIISGVGVRTFYSKKLGYRLENNYMVKDLKINYTSIIQKHIVSYSNYFIGIATIFMTTMYILYRFNITYV